MPAINDGKTTRTAQFAISTDLQQPVAGVDVAEPGFLVVTETQEVTFILTDDSSDTEHTLNFEGSAIPYPYHVKQVVSATDISKVKIAY